MNLQILKPGHKVKLRDGAVARVLAETEDGNSIWVQYLGLGNASSPVGAEAMVDEHEIETNSKRSPKMNIANARNRSRS